MAVGEVLETPVSGRPTPTPRSYSFFEPLVDQWLAAIRASEKAKAPWTRLARMCEAFFDGEPGFMWKDNWRSRVMGDKSETASFQVVLNKAYEFVSIYGPHLYWRYPGVRVKPQELPKYDQRAFANPVIYQEALRQLSGYQLTEDQLNPEVVARLIYGQDAIREFERQAGAQLMEQYLNYSHKEQPDASLSAQIQSAVDQALLTGRGIMFPQTYTHPGSKTKLTGVKWYDVHNVGVDPGCEDPHWADAQFIWLYHEEPQWKVERRFGLPYGELSAAAFRESPVRRAQKQDSNSRIRRKSGQAFDIVGWYEIWSRAGCGTRLVSDQNEESSPRLNRPFARQIEKTVGDYAYLCIAPGINYPLNCHPRRMSRMKNRDVKKAFRWRSAGFGDYYPIHKDSRWPCERFDPIPNTRSAYPIPPIAPGLGDLICLNILTCAYLEHAWSNRKQIIAVIKDAAEDLSAAIRNDVSPAVVEINREVNSSINEMVQYLNKPSGNTDILEAMAICERNFDKRVGTPAIQYGMNEGGKASRSAKDITVREEKASIRIENMSKNMATFVSQLRTQEKFLARFYVDGKSIEPLLGSFGARLWNRFIRDTDPNLVLREMYCEVQAQDMQRPNKERQITEAQMLMQWYMPLAEKFAAATGDSSKINEFIQMIGKAFDKDTTNWLFGPWREIPTEQQLAIQQQQMQMQEADSQRRFQIEQAKMQLDAAKTQSQIAAEQAAAMGKQMEMQGKLAEQQAKQQTIQLEQMLKMAQGQQNMESEQQRSMLFAAKKAQELQQAQARFDEKMTEDQQKHILDMVQDSERFRQNLEQDQVEHMQNSVQDIERHQLNMAQLKERLAIEAQRKGQRDGNAD